MLVVEEFGVGASIIRAVGEDVTVAERPLAGDGRTSGIENARGGSVANRLSGHGVGARRLGEVGHAGALTR